MDNNYETSILNLENIEDIIASLPSKNQDNYKDTIERLIMFINNEIESNNELEKESKDEEDKLFLKSELERLNHVRDVLVDKLSEVYESQTEITNEASKKNILFLMTNASNPCVEKDIKDIPNEYCDSLIELFDALENFDSREGKYNDIVCKKLTNNVAVKDVFELKAFKVRLYFELLDKDTVVVLMATLKKDDNPKSITDTLSRRLSMIDANEKRYVPLVEQLKAQISDPNVKNKLIEEHSIIKDSIISELKSKVR